MKLIISSVSIDVSESSAEYCTHFTWNARYFRCLKLFKLQNKQREARRKTEKFLRIYHNEKFFLLQGVLVVVGSEACQRHRKKSSLVEWGKKN
jgi:hypothetical protein